MQMQVGDADYRCGGMQYGIQQEKAASQRTKRQQSLENLVARKKARIAY